MFTNPKAALEEIGTHLTRALIEAAIMLTGDPKDVQRWQRIKDCVQSCRDCIDRELTQSEEL